MRSFTFVFILDDLFPILLSVLMSIILHQTFSWFEYPGISNIDFWLWWIYFCSFFFSFWATSICAYEFIEMLLFPGDLQFLALLGAVMAELLSVTISLGLPTIEILLSTFMLLSLLLPSFGFASSRRLFIKVSNYC